MSNVLAPHVHCLQCQRDTMTSCYDVVSNFPAYDNCQVIAEKHGDLTVHNSVLIERSLSGMNE